jgi:hypothetical protein
VRLPLSGRSSLPVFAVYAAVQLVQLAVLAALAPRFFWFDDAQSQFAPVMWWLGTSAEGGVPPLMDPDQGQAGNLAVDMQYGALDPLHWGLQFLASQFEDLVVWSWVYGALCVLLTGGSALWLLLHSRVRPSLAVAGAVGIASSGFLLWFGSSWWPALWSAGWLLLLWAGLASRGAAGVAVTGLATWGVLASGNPYVVPFAVLLGILQLAERRRAAGGWRAALGRSELTRIGAAFGGALLAAPTLLTSLEAAPYIGRLAPEGVLQNSGFAVPSLLDVLLGGPTLLGQLNAWGGSISPVPALGAAVIAVPLLGLVDWRRAIRLPGVPTALVLTVVAALATQLPSVHFGLRYPLRYLLILQLALPLLSLIAVSSAARLTRRRMLIAVGLAVAQFALSVSRAPALVLWHLLGLATALAAVGLALLVLRESLRWRAVVAGGLVLAAAVPLLVAERMMVSVQRQLPAAEDAAGVGAGMPYRHSRPGYAVGASVAEHRGRSYSVDASKTVLTWRFASDRGWQAGVLEGSANVLADFRTGFGSLAVWQSGYQSHVCQTYQGALCAGAGSVEALLQHAGDTGVPWIELIAQDRVVLAAAAPGPVRRYADDNWRLVWRYGDWSEYARGDGLPGRASFADGVQLSPASEVGLGRIGVPMERYRVESVTGAGTLVVRTPYWPGLTARLDGEPVEVIAFEGALAAVRLPPGGEGTLEVFYDPVGARLLLPATLLGALVVAVSSGVAAGRPGRRSGRPGSGPVREESSRS